MAPKDEVKKPKTKTTQFDSTLCPYCRSQSRISSAKGAKYRKCEKGHKFVKKTDDRR